MNITVHYAYYMYVVHTYSVFSKCVEYDMLYVGMSREPCGGG